MEKNIPRILIGAAAGGSGKTMITCGILQALKNRGMRVASYKCGPDYLDPMFYRRVIGVRSGNLDTFFTGEEITRYLLMENAREADISILEGVMGYYDGVGGTTTQASAYEMAAVTETPSVLILNGKGMSVSIAAQLKGYLEYRKDSRICGVILNQISPMLYQRMKQLLEEELGVEVLGYVPNLPDYAVESRHFGVTPPNEVPELKERIQGMAKVLEQTLNLDAIIRIAMQAAPLRTVEPEKLDAAYAYHTPEPIRLAVANDEAFCFFYEDNLRLLKKMGARLVAFSPIRDKELPKGVQGILLYGGYPELYGMQLEQNTSMKESIAQKLMEGMPCMAECGGFMYLQDTMEDMNGKPRQMLGVIPGEAYRTPKLKHYGYVTLTLGEEVFGQEIGNLSGHEFHYFDSTDCGDAYLAKKPLSNRSWNCMYAKDAVFAGFPQFHYYSNPKLPASFLEACVRYKNR